MGPAATMNFAPNQRKTEKIVAHVIWMTTGQGCDGDSVAMTSATNPSLEDIIHGIIPSAAVTLELAIKRALEEAAPDLLGIEVEGAEPAVAEHPPGQSSNGSSGPRDHTWVDCNGLVQLS